MALPWRPATGPGDQVTLGCLPHTRRSTRRSPGLSWEGGTDGQQPALSSGLTGKPGCESAFERLISAPVWDSHKSNTVSVYSRVQRKSCWESPKHLKILYGNQEHFIWRQETGRTNRPTFHLLLIQKNWTTGEKGKNKNWKQKKKIFKGQRITHSETRRDWYNPTLSQTLVNCLDNLSGRRMGGLGRWHGKLTEG